MTFDQDLKPMKEIIITLHALRREISIEYSKTQQIQKSLSVRLFKYKKVLTKSFVQVRKYTRVRVPHETELNETFIWAVAKPRLSLVEPSSPRTLLKDKRRFSFRFFDIQVNTGCEESTD